LGTATYEELRLKAPHQTNKWLLFNFSRSPRNNSVIAIGYDITSKKSLEQKHQERFRELRARNQEIMDSIRYAQQIQKAILPEADTIKSTFEDAFVYYDPKEVVSGDFYWFYRKGSKVFLIMLDCTGHGVPGAMMSVMGNSLLKDLIVKNGLENPAEILFALDQELINGLTQKENQATISDGMDIGLTVMDFDKYELSFAGAFRPMFLVRQGELKEVKGNRNPVGFYHNIQKQFETKRFSLQEGDRFYLFSDGYPDQFGGERGRKFMKKRFREMIGSIQQMPLNEQKDFLDYALNNWQQEEEQVDDILVLGAQV
jgi:serine phosphatase RsbU (regulator of sigma subunit)